MQIYVIYLYSASSIYLTNDFVPKLSGILNNRIPQRNTESKRWWAPEVFSSNIHTKKSDIFAFGVLMWEIFSRGNTPYADIDINELSSQIQNTRYHKLLIIFIHDFN